MIARMAETRPQILLTNDDGIRSPGLWAAAEALSALGFVWVAAPREQRSGSGRSMPLGSDGAIREEKVTVGGKEWSAYAVGGSPAQTIQHAILELLPQPPALVVSGINYGENVSTSITISGTIGAALEGAAFGIPALAVSQETPARFHLSHSEEVDFSAAAHFTGLFAGLLLRKEPVADVDVLKVDVPVDATPETPWRVARLSRKRYYHPISPRRRQLDEPAVVDYQVATDLAALEPGTDAYVLRVAREVAVVPLSLDLTSRVSPDDLEKHWRQP
jgi:5'-nucleotidase